MMFWKTSSPVIKMFWNVIGPDIVSIYFWSTTAYIIIFLPIGLSKSTIYNLHLREGTSETIGLDKQKISA